ncbi:hypothetical protein Tco_0502657 [Tanacetum coccineum]
MELENSQNNSNEGVQDDEGVHEKASTETELFIQEVTPTEVIHEQEGSGKASDEVSTAGKKKDTASEEVPPVSTAEVHISTAGGTVTYSRRSAEKRTRQDKGKAILIEEAPKKKSKKEIEQERLSYAEAIRLEEQMHDEQRAQIARDAEIARQWDEEEKKRAMDEAETTKKIDWNDPSVIRYHSLKMKPKSIAQARRNMIKYLKNQGNFKITDFKGMSTEKIVEEETVTQEEREEVIKEPAAKRKKSIPRKNTRKRQKLEEDTEKDELKRFLDIVPREEAPIEIESLSTKFPIVDWKTVVLTETFMYYQVFRGDGSSKNYKVLSEMLEDFDRMDVEELFRLVKERYSTSAPEGFDLMLWGDLHTLFEPDEDDEIWKDQHEYNLLSWRLCDFCGIHILLMNNGLAIHMLTEKKYPLSQEMLSKMLSTRLEVDHESSQAFELLRFIRAQSPEKERSTEKIVEEEAVTQEEREEVVKEPVTKRKKSIPRKTTRKRQKLEEDTDELKRFLDIVPREEDLIEVESLSTKFPIVDWKTCVLTETFMYYQVFRGDGSSKNYKILSEMLEDFDRMDVEQLFRLVKERYSSSAPEGFDLMLWGDLHTLFEHDEDDEIWRDQHEYNLLSWRLCDFCGIHILLMDNGLAIHMLTEKKYPLSQEMLTKMLSRKLEVDHESTQAFELLRFIRSQVKK